MRETQVTGEFSKDTLITYSTCGSMDEKPSEKV